MAFHLNEKKSISKEESLVNNCLAEKRQAQQQLYKQFYNQILSVCLRYSDDRQEAKSLVNASFLKGFKNLNQYRGKGVLGVWLTRVAINTCIDAVRKRQNYRKYTTSLENVQDVSLAENVLDVMAAEDILKCLQKVSPTSRTVFSLYIVDGYKHSEIAEMLNISVGTSRWHLSNAKKEMKVLLEQNLID